MGQIFSVSIDILLVEYLKSLKLSGQDLYTVDNFETEFPLNKLPGSNCAPKCNMFIKNSSIRFHDLVLSDTQLLMESSKISIEIGEAVVRCDDLGYTCQISGKIQLFDVCMSGSFYQSNKSGKIVDVSTCTTMNKIESEIKLQINGTDHSRLANVLLSTENPDVASNILKAVFYLLKENIKDMMNSKVKYLSDQYFS